MQRMEGELRVITSSHEVSASSVTVLLLLSDVSVVVIKMFSRLKLLQFPFLPFAQLHQDCQPQQSSTLTR